ncbi:MAG: cation-translocating P-type ATPase [Bacillota bacterium]
MSEFNYGNIESGESLTGLSDNQAGILQKKHGENVLPSGKSISPAMILLSQFRSPLIYVILGAALISLAMEEFTDFAIIMLVVVFDVILGFFQEYKASLTYRSLQSLIKPMATVIRDGAHRKVYAKDIVPEDIVVLATGDKVPADGRLLSAKSLSVNESILTGESESVSKNKDDPVFMGTSVLTGRGIMEVSSIGTQTRLGEIAQSIIDTPEVETPLQKRLTKFSNTLTKAVLVLVVVMFALGVLTGKSPVNMARMAIILAVAAIPEGLLIAVTVILVVGMKKILARQGLVKRLLAVETLGSVTVICTDKTGTLTEGLMKATQWDFPVKDMAWNILSLNNNLEGPLEVALWNLVESESGHDPRRIQEACPRLDEKPFSSENKFMVTLNQINGNRYLLIKGAPEIVVEMCLMPEVEKISLLEQFDSWAQKGQKLIGLAYRDLGAAHCTWAGLVALQDPVRQEVPEVIDTCRKAGIQIKMITGDHKLTALGVAESIGLPAGEGDVLEGKDIEAMTDEELANRVKEVTVFSRVLPHQKLRIVSALQLKGEVVAMLGDGVNDAPALKKSDIGVVVGDATDIAKETADLVLLDSNFKTIVAAVEEGRVAFQNIKKVVSYTLSNSFAEIMLVFVSMLLGWPNPLTVGQILWVHLICDGPIDIVLGFEPKEDGILEEPPIPVSEPILGKLSIGLIALISATAAAGCLWMFDHYWSVHGDIVLARTLAFETLAVISLVYVFAYRSMRSSIFHTGHLIANKPLIVATLLGFVLAFLPVTVPALRRTLGVTALEPVHWLMVFGLSFFLLALVEVGKHVSVSTGQGNLRDRTGRKSS